MLSNNLRLKFCYLKIIHILNQRYYPKVRGHILKSKRKSKCVCIHEIRQLNIMKMTMKMKKRSRRFDINRPRCRHGRKYSKYIMFLIMMMVICIKQHLSDIWSSIHDKTKLSNTEAELKKSVAHKKVCIRGSSISLKTHHITGHCFQNNSRIVFQYSLSLFKI